ncbi:aldo/keto reductase [Halorubrum vacuolatum]|uniref:Predicted oxidoreductase n=1 Tax=Halorubrum vacuolatum TaxID=63740 RepID=A0A238ULF5_HALVU|nr:aldo/keto reductase [Halorubrum vacuolatum]SNR22865.1 Predicted oxidoreductase [Halorubrum vacuolatum]
MATREALWNYRNEFGDAFGRTYFRRFGPGVIASIGLGTYRGEPTDAVDGGLRKAVGLAIRSGVNVLDTASNYRHGRSERVIGEVLRNSSIERDAVIVSTKGGFVPFEGGEPIDRTAFLRDRFLNPGILEVDDLAGGSHALAPTFLEWSLDRSLERLGVATVDCYYLHNPETQLAVRSRSAVYDAIEDGLELLERRRLAGDVGCYGIATWEAFRVPETHDSYLSLTEILARAEAVGERIGPTDDHGFEALQLPFNVHMADAFTRANQRPPKKAARPSDGSDRRTKGTDDERLSTLELAHEADLSVFTSASLAGGDLARIDAIPPAVDRELAGDTPAQRAINFARSAPGVTCALVGTADRDHLSENVAGGTFDPMGAKAFDSVFV